MNPHKDCFPLVPLQNSHIMNSDSIKNHWRALVDNRRSYAEATSRACHINLGVCGAVATLCRTRRLNRKTGL